MNNYYTEKENRFICNFCNKSFASKKDVLAHIKRYEYQTFSLEEKALYHKFKGNNSLKDIDTTVLIAFIKRYKDDLPLFDKRGRQFNSFYKMISIIRPFDINNDFSLFENKFLPWKKINHHQSNSKELCSVIFENKEEADKLYQYMLSKNPFYQHDGGLSPFSKDFIGYKNLNDEEKSKKIKEAIKVDKLDKFSNQKQYWLNKGYTEEEAKKLVSERQKTFSLEKCIKNYGEEEGINRFKKRQEKWLSNYKKQNYSQISQKLFFELFDIIKDRYKEIYFAECEKNGKNNEYRLMIENSVIKPDFFIKDINKIIEFDGDYWHSEKRGNQKRDKERDEKIIKAGYKVYHVTETDYNKNHDMVIKECLNFLYNE